MFQSLRPSFCLDENLNRNFLSHLKHHFNLSSSNSSWNFSLFIKTNKWSGQETASAKLNYHFQVEQNFINHRIYINIHYTVDEKALCTLLTWAGGTVEKTAWWNSLKYLYFCKLAVIKVPVCGGFFFWNVYLFSPACISKLKVRKQKEDQMLSSAGWDESISQFLLLCGPLSLNVKKMVQ